MCGPADVKCHVVDGFSQVIGNALGKVAESIGDSALEAMNGVATFWIKQPTPKVVDDAMGPKPANTEIDTTPGRASIASAMS